MTDSRERCWDEQYLGNSENTEKEDLQDTMSGSDLPFWGNDISSPVRLDDYRSEGIDRDVERRDQAGRS